jgi:hypothetical protein
MADTGGDAGADGAADAGRSGLAPMGVVLGEQPSGPTNPVMLPAGGGAIYRVDTQPGEHTAFDLTFPATTQGVTLSVDRWDGMMPVELGTTDGGAGFRVLAVLDQGGPRTFWVRVHTGDAVSAVLTITRTPFTDAQHCATDCAHLLQLPLPNDPRVDGYTEHASVVYRYQFGRRDLLMFLRAAGRKMAAAGKDPFQPEDLSQWDGMTPGTDVGAPRHLSHKRGINVDVSLYGLDGQAIWRSFCTTEAVSGGRQCVPGTRKDLDPLWVAREISAFYDSGRVTMCFLDQELIAAVKPAAMQAANLGLIPSANVALFGDGVHLQHWPNHDNHVHVRIAETATTTTPGETSQPIEVFEGP